MDHAEMVALIRDGVPGPGGVWADLGAGEGNFTRALGELLGPDATIYAVDRDGRSLDRLWAKPAMASATVKTIQADFTRALGLPALDGVLMANALHFVRDQGAVLALIVGYLHPGGRLIVVEYERATARPWTPYPLPFERLQSLAARTGLAEARLVGSRRSPSSGVVMYAAVVTHS